MSDLRQDILDQLKAQLQTITVANGYRHTVTTVAVEARQWDDAMLRSAILPWIGIIPRKELDFDEMNNQARCEWPIDLAYYFEFTPKTMDGLLAASSGFARDIRRCLYSVPSLGVDEVVLMTITGREGCEANAECASQGRAGVIVSIMVKFEESF